MRAAATRLLPVTLALAFAGVATEARAGWKDIRRKGGQAEIVAGASLCLPGRGECSSDATDALTGETGPMLGIGANLGWRVNKWFLVGAGYTAGWFNPDYTLLDSEVYRMALQHTVVAVLRGYLPVWRFDFGLEASPGFSRQTFFERGSDVRQYSQGFAFRPGLSVDFWITKRIFLGAKWDVMLNAHRRTCVDTGSTITCERKRSTDQAAVHQTLVGVHFGGTFGGK